MSNIFGSDIWLGIGPTGVLDVDPSMRETRGLQVLAQSLVIRQVNQSGRFIAYPDDGIDLRRFLSKGMTTAAIQQLRDQVRMQLLRDQRVTGATVTVTFNGASSTLTIYEQIQSGIGPFTLTISVNQLTVSALLNGQHLGVE